MSKSMVVAVAAGLLLLLAYAVRLLLGEPLPVPEPHPAAPHDGAVEAPSTTAPVETGPVETAPIEAANGRDADADARATAAPPAGASVSGYVCTADGAPAAAVEVAARLLEAGGPLEASSAAASGPARGTPGAAALRAATTDDAGRFAFGFPPGSTVELSWSEHGFRPGRRVVPVPAADVAITLVRCPTLRGRVVRSDGAAVGGALVSWSNPHLAVGSSRATTTSADGRFEFAAVPNTLDLEVLAPGALPVYDWVRVEWGMPELLVTVEAGRAVPGLVTDGATGEGLASATVELWFYEGTYTRDGRRGGAAQRVEVVDADRDGAFELRAMPRAAGGEYADAWLWVTAPGFAAHAQHIEAPASVESLAVALHGAGSVRGSVVDADGQPVVGQRVYAESTLQSLCDAGANRGFRDQDAGLTALWDRDRPESTAPFHGQREAFTDARGVYRIDGVPASAAGAEVVVAVAAGRPQVSATVRVGEVADAPDLQLRKPARQRWSGEVVDEAGRPIAGAEVEAGVVGGISDARGRFELHVPSRPQVTQVRAEAAGYVPTRVEVDEERRTAVSITLLRGEALTVVVVDRDQRPVADASVRVYAAGSLEGQRRSGPVLRRGQTDDRGEAVLDGVPASCDVLVEYRQPGARHREVATAVAAGAAPVRLTLAELEVTRATADLVVRVDTGALAEAFAGQVFVEVEGDHGAERRPCNGAEVRFEGLACGTWHVRASAAGVGSVANTVALAGDRDVVLVLGGGATLSGRLVATGGADGAFDPAPQVRVERVGRAPTLASVVRAAADGTFELRGLAAGDYVVTVEPFSDVRFSPSLLRAAHRCVTSAPVAAQVPAGVDRVGPLEVPVVRTAPLRVMVEPEAVGGDVDGDRIGPLARQLRFRVLGSAGDVVHDGPATGLTADAVELWLVLPHGPHRVEVYFRERVLGARDLPPGGIWRLPDR